MRKILFVTNNRDKLDEINEIAAGRVQILTLADIDAVEEIEETGATIEENALLKVRYINSRYGVDCFADDTGLETVALGGAPGVHSSRFAGEGCDSLANMDKLISLLQGVDDRRAQFRTVIALIINGEEHLFEGLVRGIIIDEKRGETGFGYDPIFIPDGYEQTFAELGNQVKNRISHRAIALSKLIDSLLKL